MLLITSLILLILCMYFDYKATSYSVTIDNFGSNLSESEKRKIINYDKYLIFRRLSDMLFVASVIIAAIYFY